MKKIRCIILIYLVSLSLRLIACGNNLEATIEPTPTASASVAAEPTSAPTPTASASVAAEPTSAPTPTAIPTKTVEPTTDTKITAEPTDEVNEVTPTTVPTPTAEPKVEEVKAVSLEAKVGGSHKVGETLSAADFTITAKMSDGSTRSNPVGWQADKLTLDSESTVITVTYEGISTKVTIAATQPQTQQQQPQPQQEQQPQAQKWPASAYGPVNGDAYQDLVDYAFAQGFGYTILTTRDGSQYLKMTKADYMFTVMPGDTQWYIFYSSPSTNGLQEEDISGKTFEHIYAKMFP